MELNTKSTAGCTATKLKEFKKSLKLATQCLLNKDYFNAEVVYWSILRDIRQPSIVEALSLNDLQVFSLQGCFAYASVATDHKSNKALVILNAINNKNIQLPLIPYLKAFIHMANDRLQSASEEVICVQRLLEKGYNFKSNDILNSDVVPEVEEAFLTLKLNGLNLACEVLLLKDGPIEVRKAYRDNYLKLGVVVETDFAKKPVPEDTNKPSGGVKKKNPPKKQIASIAVQTMAVRSINAAVQTNTLEKELNRQILSHVLDVRSKITSFQSKRENEFKIIQKRNNELQDSLSDRDNKALEHCREFGFLRDKFMSLETKLEESENKVDSLQVQLDFMQKILVEQFQQKCQMQRNIYQSFIERCEYKIDYLNDIQSYVTPSDRPTPEECRQDVAMWKLTLNKMQNSKDNFESYYSSIDEMLVDKKFSTIKTMEWPDIPTMPTDIQDSIYRNFKLIVQQSKSLYSLTMPSQQYSAVPNYGIFGQNETDLNHFNAKEDDGKGGRPYFSKAPSPPKKHNFNWNQDEEMLKRRKNWNVDGVWHQNVDEKCSNNYSLENLQYEPNFHKACINNWLKSQNSCHSCRGSQDEEFLQLRP